jgi:hypothetical protein
MKNMKVCRAESKFRPIVITLESEKEIDSLKRALGSVLLGTDDVYPSALYQALVDFSK